MVLITYAQSAPKWPGGYEWSLYVPYVLHYLVRELVQRRSTMSWHLHSKLYYINSRCCEENNP